MSDTLKTLALKYEIKEFLAGDPSWFMHQIEGDTNKELLAFIASSLSYGSRKQFMPKIQSLMDNIISGMSRNAGKSGLSSVADWLLSGDYNNAVPTTPSCFYRLYTCETFNKFLAALAGIVKEYGSLKALLQANMKTHDSLEAISIITTEFENRGSAGVIPKAIHVSLPIREDWGGSYSCCKRVCMFLRWMVRDNSPVDLGLWSDIIDKRTLVIPMDTHVVQESIRLGLLTSKSTSMSNARKLSARLAEIFPDDPAKGDFALFGVGVDESV